jgi:glyoxylase-like metal-dependent hydrolase (beta-lactamase superfamily II)/rhodanese-related sulfurtransferase
MAPTVDELNGTNCRTYLVSCDGHAILVDPVRERAETYRMQIDRRGLILDMIVETHTHADHLMINRAIKAMLGAPVVMHRMSPIPLVDIHVDEGDVLTVGTAQLHILHTPGHTPDSMALVGDGFVLSGDTLMIEGSGRTDFPDGDAGAQYDGVTSKLFALPDDTVVWPGHDYRGRTSTTIGHEKAHNPRLAGRSRADYVEIMGSLGLPFPDKIQQALQVNQSGFEQDEVAFPGVADVASVPEISAAQLGRSLASGEPPLLLDVREPEEFVGELGHVRGSLLVPLDSLGRRLPKILGYADREVVVVCRAGARSRTAAAILRGAGFRRVLNLTGGMLAWTAAGLPIEH